LKEAYGFGLLTFIGVLLILMGLILVILPFIMKLGIKLESIHPRLLVWRRVDGFYVGTSPILLIILVLVYLFLVLIRRPL
jgi:hypothetical protein